MNAWLFLVCAVLFEVSGTTCMKLSSGFSRIIPSALMFFFYGISFVALTLAIKKFDVSVAYAVWSGLGTALIAVIGILYFKEPLTALKVVCTLLIIAGVVGLNYSGSGH
jgi:small multidrug resistance pump